MHSPCFLSFLDGGHISFISNFLDCPMEPILVRIFIASCTDCADASNLVSQSLISLFFRWFLDSPFRYISPKHYFHRHAPLLINFDQWFFLFEILSLSSLSQVTFHCFPLFQPGSLCPLWSTGLYDFADTIPRSGNVFNPFIETYFLCFPWSFRYK